MRAWFLVLVAAVLSAAGCKGDDPPNLLAGRGPSHASNVADPERITDGVYAPSGSEWNGQGAAVFQSRDGQVAFDLGADQRVAAISLEGDNNDVYIVELSPDGQRYEPAWEAPPVAGAGMRERHVDGLDRRGRFVRIRAAGGDGAYSLAEVQLFSRTPGQWPVRIASLDPPRPLRHAITFFGIAAQLCLWLACVRGGRGRALFGAAFVVATVYLLYTAAAGAPSSDEMVWLRLVLAAGGLALVLQPLVLRTRSDGGALDRTAGVLAVMSLLCFYNLGHPQFWDARTQRGSYIHSYDLRVYFPAAKYFDELRFDGVYLASVAAYLENAPSTLDDVAEVPIRNLHTHRLETVGQVKAEVAAIKRRFSPERWHEFRADMKYFLDLMGGQAYLHTLTDHGGNATPVWFLPAHFLFRWASASDATLLATALLDPLLVLALAVVLARTFGARAAFLCLIVFGANDYYQFGTNWGGATLRNDWMVALGLAVAALHRGRHRLGGALLAYSALIRAFPALAVLALPLPALGRELSRRRRGERWGGWRELLRRERPTVDAIVGAIACVVVLGALSTLVFSPEAWLAWTKKASVLSAGMHANHLSIRSLVAADWASGEVVAGWTRHPVRLLGFVAGLMVFVGAALVAGGRSTLVRVPLIGMLLVPAVFYPANYYFHFVFLLPLLALPVSRPADSAPSAILFVMCIAQALFTQSEDITWHFFAESLVVVPTFLALLIVAARLYRPQAASA